MKTYSTTGTCSRAINYEVEDGVLTKCEFVGGCPGNTRGVAKLAIGRKIEDVTKDGAGSDLVTAYGEL